MQNQLMKLKALRAERNISQIAMAKKLGIHVSTYCEKENGYMPFTQWEIEVFLKYFNVTYEDIFIKEEKRDYSYGSR